MEKALVRSSDESREIVSQLREQLRRLEARHHDRITENGSKHWIGWRSEKFGRVFAEVRALRGRVQVFILPRKQDLTDPAGLVRPAPKSQGWGWFRSHFDVTSLADVEFAFRLIRQSYERARKKPHGRSLRSRTAREPQTS
ncbi:MAG TPA: hypothetical protein VIB49_09795 [Thermoplasmata archaeon]|jgi:predicted transport protein